MNNEVSTIVSNHCPGAIGAVACGELVESVVRGELLAVSVVELACPELVEAVESVVGV